MNKFWPKYTVILDGTKLALLSAKKLANSKTSHYRIELANSNNKYKQQDEEHYIGRVRASAGNHEFFIFDTGINPADVNKKGVEGPERRQFGTIVYSKDKYGDKNPREMKVYLPMIDDSTTNYMSWPDN